MRRPIQNGNFTSSGMTVEFTTPKPSRTKSRLRSGVERLQIARRERLVLLALSLVERMAIWPVPVCRQPRALPRCRSLPTLQSAHARNVGYRTRGGKGYHARLELRSPPLCAHVCRKQARRKARKVKHGQLRSPRCCRSFEPLHPVRAIGSRKMETHIVCIVDADATTIPTREETLLLSNILKKGADECTHESRLYRFSQQRWRKQFR